MEAAVALGLGLSAAPVVLWGLRRAQLFDLPTSRSSHCRPTPRAGGLAPAFAVITASLLSTGLPGSMKAPVLTVALGFGLIGLTDDLRGLAPLPRLMGQLAVAATALVWLGRGIDVPPLWIVITSAGIVVWLVAYVNAFNFMDGINGISAAQVLFAGTAWWAIGSSQDVPELAILALIATAAIAAFAPFNFPRAAMFLGDVGSYFFGGWLATVAVVGLRAGIAPEAVLAPLALYVADTLTAFVRRALRHDDCFSPHRDHVYQQLVDEGWSHSQATSCVGIIIALTSALGALSLTTLPLRVVGDTLACALLVGYLVLPSILPRAAVCSTAT